MPALAVPLFPAPTDGPVTLVQVDLDGLNGNDTSLDDLAAALDAVDGISASITAGKLRVSADSSDVEFSFSQDTSGALAAVGVNNFFTGSDARDIAVNAALKTKPSLLAAAKNGNAGDNQTALAIAGLESAKLAALFGAAAAIYTLAAVLLRRNLTR